MIGAIAGALHILGAIRAREAGNARVYAAGPAAGGLTFVPMAHAKILNRR